MITFKEAKQILKENPLPKKSETRSLEKGFGLILAEEVRACLDVPLFDNSAMDGYALISDGASSFKLIGEVKAGDVAHVALGRGEAVRIMTGAKIPDGADTVVMRELAQEQNGALVVKTLPRTGDHIRRRAEEIRAGEVALEVGQRLNPAALSYLASVGVPRVHVFAPPKVAVVVTGNELVDSVAELEPGKILDSNTLTLKTALKEAGVETITSARALDEPESLRRTVEQALLQQDCLLISGGISVGNWDFTKKVLEELGVRELFWKVAQKPGKPLYFGAKGEKRIFALPGNPASVLVCFYEYVYPYLRHAMGWERPELKKVNAIFSGEERKKTGVTYFSRAELFFDEGKPQVRLLSGQESFRLGSFAAANALALLPATKELIQTGDLIEVHLLP
jgi:molybdopterin molybdotransferase